jgi:inner membrane protein
MPSPVAHTTVAYLLWRAFGARPLPSLGLDPRRLPPLLAATTFLCLLPDLPSIYGLLVGQLARYHNSWEHSLPVALVVALACALIARVRPGQQPLRWFWIGLFCYGSHLIMDSLTVGRGVMLLWPFTGERFGSPIRLFYGLHWSDGWLAWKHLVTLVTELVFAGLLVWAAHHLEGDRLGSRRRPAGSG